VRGDDEAMTESDYDHQDREPIPEDATPEEIEKAAEHDISVQSLRHFIACEAERKANPPRGRAPVIKLDTTKRDMFAADNVRTRHKMFTVLKNGHLLLWAKQLAMRGTARNFDGDGVCGAMKLVAIGDFDLWFNSHEIMFPGARFEYSAVALKGGGLAKSLADFILAHPKGGFDSREACEACGIKPANFARTLKTPVVEDALKRTGLVVSNTRPVRFIQFKDEPPLAIAAE
jgi:hypothetical protein